jgi:hypothetical protein
MLRKGASERDLYRMCTKTFTWRLLTGPELTEVYLNEMRRDFPAGELKPLSMILTSEAEGTAHTWGVFDGDTLAAYLLMVRPEGCRVSQLAVNGRDLMAAGIPAGPGLRRTLEALLDAVIRGQLLNERQCLLDAAGQISAS